MIRINSCPHAQPASQSPDGPRPVAAADAGLRAGRGRAASGTGVRASGLAGQSLARGNPLLHRKGRAGSCIRKDLRTPPTRQRRELVPDWSVPDAADQTGRGPRSPPQGHAARARRLHDVELVGRVPHDARGDGTRSGSDREGPLAVPTRPADLHQLRPHPLVPLPERPFPADARAIARDASAGRGHPQQPRRANELRNGRFARREARHSPRVRPVHREPRDPRQAAAAPHH